MSHSFAQRLRRWLPWGKPDRSHRDDPEARGRVWRLRLAFSIPAILILFVLGFGLGSLLIFEHYWPRIEKSAGVGELLQGHIYLMLGMSGLAFIGGIALAFAILKPLKLIEETVKDVARGKLDQRAPKLIAAPELGDLSRSFNSMIDFLNESIQERDRRLIEGMVSGVMTVNADGGVVSLNSTGAAILGVDSARVIGRSISELRDSLASRMRPLWDYIEDGLAGERPPISDILPIGSGDQAQSLLVWTSYLRMENASLPGLLLLNFRDAAEISSLREQLYKTDQLAALGTFTVGLAHELRNPLSAIKGIIQLMRSQPMNEEDSRASLEIVVREVNRIDQFISELHEFSHRSTAQPDLADLATIMRHALQRCRGVADQLADKNITVVEDYLDTPKILVEADRLEQAFVNLIRNAYEAAAPGAVITLHTRPRREGGEDYALAYVHNTGSTIPAAVCGRIFEPFFTTKEKGTGLGLAISYQIVTQQRGALDVSVGVDEVVFIAKFKSAQTSESAENDPPPAEPDAASRMETAAV